MVPVNSGMGVCPRRPRRSGGGLAGYALGPVQRFWRPHSRANHRMWAPRAKHRREDGPAPGQSERCARVVLADAPRDARCAASQGHNLQRPLHAGRGRAFDQGVLQSVRGRSSAARVPTLHARDPGVAQGRAGQGQGAGKARQARRAAGRQQGAGQKAQDGRAATCAAHDGL